ncbi:MAG: LysR substrate-binding domain-containing protein [Maricaulaceae bacterium]|jgi:LysR family glycine cleavage system transcriptional activator
MSELSSEPHRRLPPLNALRAFEAAARHENLARAAAELGVTPGAVSQQIRQLEELLGVALFRRQQRGVALTADAAAVLPLVSDAFERLRAAGEALAGAGDVSSVRVGAPGAFGARWLAPHAGEFEREQSEFTVNVIAEGGAAAALERGQIDLEIRYGEGAYPGWESRRLFSETVSPGVAPRLLAESGLGDAAALAELPLVHDGSSVGDPDQPDWPEWLREQGIERTDAARGDRYRSPGQVVDAVVAGRGVGLVRRSFAQREIDEGRIAILMTGGLVTLRRGYDVVWQKGRVLSAGARAFRDWLLAETAHFEGGGV